MKTLLIKVKSKAKAKLLIEMLKEMSFVLEVSFQDNEAEAKDEHETMKQAIVFRKNPAFAKYLE